MDQQNLPAKLAPQQEAIRVLIRIRPLLSYEEGCPISVTPISDNAIEKVYGEETTQIEFFRDSGICEVIQDALFRGFSASIFAYGQTGTGKTFTISGPEPQTIEEIEQHRIYGLETDGILPQSASFIFDEINQHPELEFQINISFMELYNEQIYDLLVENRTPLQLRGARNNFYVDNLQQITCNSREDVISLLERGARNRHVSSHKLNLESSRSHAILTLKIQAKEKGDGDEFQPIGIGLQNESSQQQGSAMNQRIGFGRGGDLKGIGNTLQRQRMQQLSAKVIAGSLRRGKISFVDLAGSERLKLTGSENENKRETMSINKSLFTLGTVIKALSSHSLHIPYRDSKLTILLKDSLGGAARTIMIGCITPSVMFSSISLSTLQYAQQVQSIKNTPIRRMGADEASIQKMKEEIKVLRKEIEFWRSEAEKVTKGIQGGIPTTFRGGSLRGGTLRDGSNSNIQNSPSLLRKSSFGIQDQYSTGSLRVMKQSGLGRGLQLQQQIGPLYSNQQQRINNGQGRDEIYRLRANSLSPKSLDNKLKDDLQQQSLTDRSDGQQKNQNDNKTNQRQFNSVPPLPPIPQQFNSMDEMQQYFKQVMNNYESVQAENEKLKNQQSGVIYRNKTPGSAQSYDSLSKMQPNSAHSNISNISQSSIQSSSSQSTASQSQYIPGRKLPSIGQNDSAKSTISNSYIPNDVITDNYLEEINDKDELRQIAQRMRVESSAAISTLHALREQLQNAHQELARIGSQNSIDQTQQQITNPYSQIQPQILNGPMQQFFPQNKGQINKDRTEINSPLNISSQQQYEQIRQPDSIGQNFIREPSPLRNVQLAQQQNIQQQLIQQHLMQQQLQQQQQQEEAERLANLQKQQNQLKQQELIQQQKTKQSNQQLQQQQQQQQQQQSQQQQPQIEQEQKLEYNSSKPTTLRSRSNRGVGGVPIFYPDEVQGQNDAEILELIEKEKLQLQQQQALKQKQGQGKKKEKKKQQKTDTDLDDEMPPDSALSLLQSNQESNQPMKYDNRLHTIKETDENQSGSLQIQNNSLFSKPPMPIPVVIPPTLMLPKYNSNQFISFSNQNDNLKEKDNVQDNQLKQSKQQSQIPTINQNNQITQSSYITNPPSSPVSQQQIYPIHSQIENENIPINNIKKKKKRKMNGKNSIIMPALMMPNQFQGKVTLLDEIDSNQE